MSKPIALCEIKKKLGQKFIVCKMFVELMKSNLNIELKLEHLINTPEYKYYNDKRKDKQKTKTISRSLIRITAHCLLYLLT